MTAPDVVPDGTTVNEFDDAAGRCGMSEKRFDAVLAADGSPLCLADRWVNLVLQGVLSSGAGVVVSARYDDPVAVALIDTRIRQQDPFDMVNRLLALEAGAT